METRIKFKSFYQYITFGTTVIVMLLNILHVQTNTVERIVTDREQILKGVAVDYSYNETGSRYGRIVSSSGCPKSINGYPWVKHQPVGYSEDRCYLVGTPGDCERPYKEEYGTEEWMMVAYQPESEYGFCQCNFQKCKDEESLESMSKGNFRYTYCKPERFSNEMVYDVEKKLCHFLYQQGPCEEGEWLEKERGGGVICAQRLCHGNKKPILSGKSERDMVLFANVTEENVQCDELYIVDPAEADERRVSCKNGYFFSEIFKKCYKRFNPTGVLG